MNFKRIAACVLLFSMSILFICIPYATVHASKSDKGQERQAEEVESFVRMFYEAHTEEDFEKIKEQLPEGDPDRYEIRLRVFFQLGLQRYDNIVVKAYSMKDKQNWLAVVKFDAFFEGIDIGIPGSVTVLVQRQEDDQWKILTDCPDDLYEEARQMMETEEMIEWINAVNIEFNDIISENPEFLDWLTALSDSFDKAYAIEVLRNGDEENTAVEEDNTEAPNRDIYIVQKGDCLWSIAQDEFGDGMRWNELYEENKEVIGDNPDLILTGIRLIINAVF